MYDKNINNTVLDLIGIGFGPFNLGLAALLYKAKDFSYLFLEKKQSFEWHEGMLLNNSKLQVHYLKDLVSLIDPTSHFSFLCHLVETNRIFQFLHRKEQSISREEFNNYYKWAANKIIHVNYDNEVNEIDYKDGIFIVKTQNKKIFYSKNIVLGTGTTPNILPNVEQYLGDACFHNAEYKSAKSKLNFKYKKIAIVGGGQSGAEVLDDILHLNNLPSEIDWISRRTNFHPLEDACFSNEFYSPSYTKYFFDLPLEVRKNKLKNLLLSSDGISIDIANSIYNKIYDMKFVKCLPIKINLLLRHSLQEMKLLNDKYSLKIINLDKNSIAIKKYDIVIFATGYKCTIPQFLSNLFPTIKGFEDFELNPDYSVKWLNPDNRIYIQNGLKHKFGIADANLSLAAWRNAVIINSILKKDIYNVNIDSPIFKINF